MIDFEKKQYYRRIDVDAAHELLFARAKALARALKCFNETVEQARWMDRHRGKIRKLEMSDGSIILGERADVAWEAFNDNGWLCFDGVVGKARELEAVMEENGLGE